MRRSYPGFRAPSLPPPRCGLEYDTTRPPGQPFGTCGGGGRPTAAPSVGSMTILLSDPPARAIGPRLDVDLAAVADNTRLIAARTSGSLLAVVKADGFGHGALDVARTALAHGATWLGVTS